MNVLIDLLVPSVFIPIFISGTLWFIFKQQAFKSFSGLLAMGWLPSFFWLHGWPSLIPSEANDWLWMFALISALACLLFSHKIKFLNWLQILLFSTTIVLISLPVLRYNFSWWFIIELSVVVALATGSLFLMCSTKNDKPAFIIAIAATGTAVTIGLGGSLILGQLSAALAGILAFFAITEIFTSSRQNNLSTLSMIPLLLILIMIIWIAFVFAEVALIPLILCLLSLIVGFIIQHRYSFIGTILCVLGAISWLLLSAEPASYY